MQALAWGWITNTYIKVRQSEMVPLCSSSVGEEGEDRKILEPAAQSA